MINRVKELLGLDGPDPAPPSGRLVTSAITTADKKASAGASTPTPLSPPGKDSSSNAVLDCTTLLAAETGGIPPSAAPLVAPTAPPVVVPTVITEAMLDQIAQRVADRLLSGTFGADLREAMLATVRDAVRSAVSDTSERLVQDEIARIRALVERDTP